MSRYYLTTDTVTKHIFTTKNHASYYQVPKDVMTAIDYTDFDIGLFNYERLNAPTFVKGEHYMLQGKSCDGFDMEPKEYELVGVIDKFENVDIDSVIVKQVSDNDGFIFTLSKNDAASIGIEYEEGLQLLPKKLQWKRVFEKVAFNPNDLSTTPRSKIDNTVRYVVLEIKGFEYYRNGYVISPSGKVVPICMINNTLTVIAKQPIIYGNGFVIDKGTRLTECCTIHPANVSFPYGGFLTENKSIYVIIQLGMMLHGKRPMAIDYKCGVEPHYLKGVSPTDLFDVMWDESECKTLKEIEEKHKQLALVEKEIVESKTSLDECYEQLMLKHPITFRWIDESFNEYCKNVENMFKEFNWMFDNIENIWKMY